jgi:hypothetical protein
MGNARRLQTGSGCILEESHPGLLKTCRDYRNISRRGLRTLCSPTASWWVTVFALLRVLKDANLFIQRRQGLSSLLTDKKKELRNLKHNICKLADVEGPLRDAKFDDPKSRNGYLIEGQFPYRRSARGVLWTTWALFSRFSW